MSPFRKEDYACSKSFDITNLIGGVPFIPKLRTMNSLPMQVPQDNLNYCFVNSNGQPCMALGAFHDLTFKRKPGRPKGSKDKVPRKTAPRSACQGMSNSPQLRSHNAGPEACPASNIQIISCSHNDSIDAQLHSWYLQEHAWVNCCAAFERGLVNGSTEDE